MNQPTPIQSDLARAEQTLRLLAAMPAPEGLEARMHAALKAAPAHGNVLAWPTAGGQMRSWIRGAAVAAIVGVIAGGSWGVYSRVQPAEPQRAVEMPRVTGSGSFSNAGAMRTPQTLDAPLAPPADAAQPSASDQAKPQPAAKTTAHATAAKHKHAQTR
ncbi:MAG TPA: hypothetical protein VN151_12890 [Terracidiphilus sp.]|nr:hypothetical protein [Terracidiphilus sp.]